jgi:DNA topoisomerase VI subunit B
MQRNRLKHPPLIRIHRQKPPNPVIIIPSTQIIEPGIGIKLLPGIQVAVLRASRLVDEQTKGIIGIGVGQVTNLVGQAAGGNSG